MRTVREKIICTFLILFSLSLIIFGINNIISAKSFVTITSLLYSALCVAMYSIFLLLHVKEQHSGLVILLYTAFSYLFFFAFRDIMLESNFNYNWLFAIFYFLYCSITTLIAEKHANQLKNVKWNNREEKIESGSSSKPKPQYINIMSK